MWKLQDSTNLLTRLILTLIFTAQLFYTTQALSDKRLCADENCKDIISMGTGKINYPAGEEGMVSFKINAPLRIKSKSAGKDQSLWGIEVNGREGYAPKKLIKETKIIISDKKLKHIVDVKPANSIPNLSTSEKLVEQGNTVEATTTEPLNQIPTESTEKPLVNNTSENYNSSETPAVATTPVVTDIVDGTQMPISDNELDGVVENIEDESASKSQMKEQIDYEDEIGDYDDDKEEEQILKETETSELNNTVDHSTKDNINSNEKLNLSANDSMETKLGQIENPKEENRSDILNDHNSTNKDITKLEEPQNKAESNEQLTKENFSEVLQTTKDNHSTENEVASQTLYQHENETQENDSKLEVERQEQPQINDAEYNQQSSLEIVQNSATKNDTSVSDNKSNVENIDSLNQVKQFRQDTVENNDKNKKDNVEIVNKQNKMLDTVTKTDLEQIESSKEENRSDQNLSNNDITKNLEGSLNKVKIPKDSMEKPKENHESNKQVTNENTSNESNNNNSTEKDIISKTLQDEENEEVKESDLKLNGKRQEQPQIDATETKIKPKDSVTLPLEYNQQSSMQVMGKNTTEDVLPVGDNKISVENMDPLKAIKQVKEDTIENNKDNIGIENKQNDVTKNEFPLNDNIKNDNFVEQHEELSKTVNSNRKKGVQAETNLKQIYLEQFVKADQSNNDNMNSLPTDEIKTESNNVNTATESSNTDNASSTGTSEIVETSKESQHYTEEAKINEQVERREQNMLENINSMPYIPHNDATLNTPSPTPPSHYDYTTDQLSTTAIPPNDYYAQQHEGVTSRQNDETFVKPTITPNDYYDTLHSEINIETSSTSVNSFHEETTVSYESIPTPIPETPPDIVKSENEQPKTLPSSMPSFEDNKEKQGLFATIMGTVNNVLSINKKHAHHEHNGDNELDRILFSKDNVVNKEENIQYCKQIGPNGECPQSEQNPYQPHSEHLHHSCTKSIFNSDLNFETFLQALASKILEISELLAFLIIAAAACLFFIFGYYCFCNSSREGALLSKLNQLESSLLAIHKENAILKHNLLSTRQKLASIEDNSFGSNDMVVSLKKELEEELMEKARLQEQITVLQKELENAADAGIELNKIVSELLSNQTGDESIISSVEELQKQLNEQQNTILEINASLAEKSRENSELQLLIAEQNARYEGQLANVQRDNDELEHEKSNLLTRLEELKNDYDKDITAALEGKNVEIKRLQNEIVDLTNKMENEHTKWQTSVAKIEALEECLKNIRKDPSVNILQVIDVANVKAQLIEIQKKNKVLKERLEVELDQRKLSETQLQILTAEVEKLKQDFNQSEKDKLEAQTRLEVLSNYFKDKENQLQKELSLKEAMWLKQQGETTTTVDRVTAMQEEIQSLKSQNDALRAEIEAQVAAHKAQTGTLENRAHETWLAARQADRRYEEARAEATALRRQLTALAGGNVNEVNKPPAGPSGINDELTQAPSPIHMESPGSPMLGRMPPPPFLPPPFMGPPPPFMGMPPPPPFVPPGEMRPAPLGRIMSPPPPQRSGRFSPQHLDYEDYMDYEGNNTWHRHTYSPPPRTYRSLSPTDSRYNYGTEHDLISTYDTETDFSPPPSPRESRRRDGRSSEIIDNTKNPYGNTKRINAANKGPLSSGSEKSFNTSSHHDTKTKKGGGGKSLV